jgi:hypothetical protein
MRGLGSAIRCDGRARGGVRRGFDESLGCLSGEWVLTCCGVRPNRDGSIGPPERCSG